jgi:hypothetical protein
MSGLSTKDAGASNPPWLFCEVKDAPSEHSLPPAKPIWFTSFLSKDINQAPFGILETMRSHFNQASSYLCGFLAIFSQPNALSTDEILSCGLVATFFLGAGVSPEGHALRASRLAPGLTCDSITSTFLISSATFRNHE